jgi:hypothetical protein
MSSLSRCGCWQSADSVLNHLIFDPARASNAIDNIRFDTHIRKIHELRGLEVPGWNLHSIGIFFGKEIPGKFPTNREVRMPAERKQYRMLSNILENRE